MTASTQITRKNKTLVLAYDNPPRGYMTASGAKYLAQIIEASAVDPDTACIVITGHDPAVFVRHYDVGEIVKAGEAVRSGAIGPEAMRGGPFGELVDAVAATPKPVIAAINGICMGGGFELALACDLRIAGANAMEIGLPETRLGIFPGGGGTQRLPRLIGEAKALEFILKGMVVDAPEALRLGLVHEVASDPLARALELGEVFALRGAEGIAAAKALVRSALGQPIENGLLAERQAFGRVLATSDAAMAAMAHFLANGENILLT